MQRFVRNVLIVTITFTMVLFSQCSGTAARENKVTVYTSLNEDMARQVFTDFTGSTGIQVEWVRLSTGEALARIEAERANPQASVWFGGVGLGHIEARLKGLTTPYLSPNLSVSVPFHDPDYYWSGLYAGILSFATNTHVLQRIGATIPHSWADLTKPIFRNQVQMANPGSSGTSFNILVTIIQLYGEEIGFEFMRKLHQNIPQYTRSGNAPIRNAALGEIGVAIGYSHDIIRLVNEGYPLEISFPKEGTGFEIAAISLLANGPSHQAEAAKKLYDWALGQRAAEIYAKHFVVPFYPVTLAEQTISIDQVNAIIQDDVWAANNRIRLVDTWNDILGTTASQE